MTQAKNKDARAAEKGSGQGGVSNQQGTATGPGSSSATGSRQDNQHGIAGTSTANNTQGQPGHKANS